MAAGSVEVTDLLRRAARKNRSVRAYQGMPIFFGGSSVQIFRPHFVWR